MIPPRGRAPRHFGVRAFSGLDVLISWLPDRIRIPIFARKIARSMGPPSGPAQLTFSLPDGSTWEVLDAKGGARPWKEPKHDEATEP